MSAGQEGGHSSGRVPGLDVGKAGHEARRVVLVTGLSGGGKASILRVLEDLGYEAVDNPPLRLMEELAVRGERPIAIGVDARSSGFDAHKILAITARLQRNPALRPELVFVFADEGALLRRYTETRRRHPLAPISRVSDGISAEIVLTAPLRKAADMLLDTTDLPLPMLRRIIEQRFGGGTGETAGMTVSLTSFAYPAGLPREAELVFDARFLRNPHYDPILRYRTGLDAEVAAYVEADPDFEPFVNKITDLLTMLLPRFVQEGKKYASVAVGCTGGRHRSVHIVQLLAERLGVVSAGAEKASPWRVGVTHRELSRGGSRGEWSQDADVGGREPDQGDGGRGDGRQGDEQNDSGRHAAGPLDTGAGGLTHIP